MAKADNDVLANGGDDDLEALLAQAEDLAASVADTLATHDEDVAKAETRQAVKAAEGKAAAGGDSDFDSDSDQPLDVDSLLSAVEELGRDLDGLGEGYSPSDSAVAEPEPEPGLAVEAVPGPETDPGPESTTEPAPTEVPEPQPEPDASPVPDFTPDFQPDPGAEPEPAAPAFDQPTARDSSSADAESTPGLVRVLWWAILQSPPVTLADRLLTLIDKPVAAMPKSAKNLIGYGGLLMAVLGTAGLGAALLGQ